MSAVLKPTPDPSLDGMREAFDRQRSAFGSDMNPSYEVRLDRLNRLFAMTERIAPAIVQAISADFGHRSAHVTRLADVMMVLGAIKHARRHLKSWMKVRRAPTALAFQPGRSRIVPQPLGVVGVVSAWNYPYHLCIVPAIAAISAGNRVMIKPSELSPRLADLLRLAVAETFEPEEMTVVVGGPEVGAAFVALPFDHLLFTGSTAVGRRVALAAAANLTPVTLELGGKSPAILGRSIDMQVTASRLVAGKLLNSGQTCIAPDYVMVHRDAVKSFTHAMRLEVQRQYPGIAANPDYTSIVSDRHFGRLQGLLDDAREHGAQIVPLHPEGTSGPSVVARKLAPVLVLDVNERMKIMQEEIFGPLLPVMAYDTIEDVVAYVNRHERPLALYWFGTRGTDCNKVLTGTISGGVTINDCIWHSAQEEMPFGGVGQSGMGAYHGEYGFRTFSKHKPVFHQSALTGTGLLRPPYGRTFEIMSKVLKVIS